MIKTLNLIERLAIPTVLPKEGNYVDLLLTDHINRSLEVTKDELALYEIKQNEQAIVWNEQGAAASFEVDFSEPELALITKQLKKLEAEQKLPFTFLSIYEKFAK